ncbi:MAG TPA: hypothetical protein VMJ10_28485 [Kofleriaceae bacterium]|nr:hypothetical protein [Kofleriaceae bacterium]
MHRSSLVLACAGIWSSVAAADNGPVVAVADPPAPSANPSASAPSPAPIQPAGDGPRFRNGFSLSASEEFGSGPSSGLSGQLFGLDWRIGAHINQDYSIYLQTHLSFGNAHIGTTSGVTGDFASAVMAERMLPARTFVAVGAGYGVLNNPSGMLVQGRIGWYPFESSASVVSRRLNVALDARLYFPGDAIGTVTQVAATIGYDRF